MKFIVKDLMVTVLPFEPKLPSGGCGDAGATCACTCTPCTGGCSPCSDCSKCSTSTPGDILDWIAHVYDPVILSQLKEQLKVTLASVEAREKAAREALRPTTQPEIDVLRTHLTAALDELKKMPVEHSAQGSEKKA